MKFNTFYKIFYRHRIQKASIIRKIYLLSILPFVYFYDYLHLEKKKNLDIYSSEKAFLFSKDLNFLFEYFNSDKGQYFINQYSRPSKIEKKKIQAHGYSKYYEKIFQNLKYQEINILEIGSFYGNASAAMYFYFKNANIYGGDINPDMFKFKSKRIKSFFVNSNSEVSIQKDIIGLNKTFKIIIEDASHMLKDQIISFFYLFPLVEKKGYFIIEELDFPEKRADMRIEQSFPDLKTILLNIKKDKDFSSEYINEDQKKYVQTHINEIQILQGNFNEIAIIKKK